MPYFSLIAPLGWKSASREYLMPILSAKALCDQTLSTLTPRTSASSWSNERMSLTKQACSFVHVGLQSNGYHTSTTFFLPAKSESFTSFLSWFCNAKSGAVCPTPIAMFFLRSVWIRCHHHIESYPASPAAQRLRTAMHRTFLGVHFFQKICRPTMPCPRKQLATHR